MIKQSAISTSTAVFLFVLLSYAIQFSLPQVLYAVEPLKVGVIVPLSGAWAEYGEAVQNSVSMALNAENNPDTIKFFFEDDQYDPKTTLSAYQKLRTKDGVDVVITWGNGASQALVPLAERDQVLMLAFAQDPEVSKGKKHIVRMLNPASEYAARLAQHLKQKSFEKLALVKCETAFFNLWADELQKRLPPESKIEIIESVLPTELDLRITIAKLKQQKVDGVGLFLPPAQIVKFASQAVDLHFKPYVFGLTPFESRTVIQDTHGFLDGAEYVHHPVSAELQEQYIGRFGSDAQLGYVGIVVDLIGMLLRVAKDDNSDRSVDNLIKALAIAAQDQTGSSVRGIVGKRYWVDSAEEGRRIGYEIVVKKIFTPKGSR